MSNNFPFTSEILRIDTEKESNLITSTIKTLLRNQLKRKGIVVALSGGVDSSVTASLCVRAVGKSRVLGLLMPEKDSSEDTLRLSKLISEYLGIETAYFRLLNILAGDFADNRGDHIAGPAPRRPEINQHRHIRGVNRLVECGIGQLNHIVGHYVFF